MPDALGNIDSISAAAQQELAKAGDRADLPTRFEEQTYLLAQARRKLAEAKVKSLEQDIKERKRYARKIFKLICWWIGSVMLVLLLSGFSGWTRFSLGIPVLLATIGSTTVNVLGLFIIVAHYLFPTRAPRKVEKPK